MGNYKFISVLEVLLTFFFMKGFALTGNETDRLALLEVKARITSDPLGVTTSWNDTIHFCHWHGVTCGRHHQRVTELNLSSLKLAGSISPHVGNLSFLKVMHLQNNSFSNEISPEIGRLHRLQDLHLGNNSLSGEIPSNLSACTQLFTIRVGYNLLVGKIPQGFGTLSKLIFLRIEHNNLTGSLPHSFSNLSSLQELDASYNNLSGSIPDMFGQLTNLKWFILEFNGLSGKIPPSFFNLSSITDIAVIYNNLEGSFPSNLGVTLPSLQWFGVDYNQFSGTIPVSLSNASNLVYLATGGNQLRGGVPSLGKSHKLEQIILSNNNLGNEGASDSSFLCDLINATNLAAVEYETQHFWGYITTIFSAAANNIYGPLPIGFGNLANLEGLWLNYNKFSGHIPLDLGKLGQLSGLYMSRNSFTGIVPSSFGNLSQLTELFLEDNKLQGNIPSSLAQCQNLMTLSLYSNNLSGIIPPEVLGLASSYLKLDFSQNHFTGSLPKEVGNLINLEYLDVSDNILLGEIPGTLGSCLKIEYLNMQGNSLQGPIPSSLASLRGIEELYLSRNNLSGTIPEFLEHFVFLHALNLSYNNLEGRAPTEGVFKNATSTSMKGNIRLCGGIPEFQLPPCKVQHPKRRGLSETFKLILSLVCGILGITFALVFLYLGCLRKERKQQSTPSDSAKFLNVSYQLLLKATNGFSSANLIGAGSFGSVYKGVLDQGETTIAVKVLNLVHRGASKSFAAECEALKNLRHRNLLKVLSACSGFDYKGDDFKALVYEFMVNGSLEEWLHVPQRIELTNERPSSLMLSERLNIAIDVSMALDYLHNHCETPIVHCDLKPSNVLLDDDMVGHVGDFGLVRFLPRNSGNQSSSVGVKGTIGYAPPEYGMGNEVWTGDVYSFGILLLEMFTGKRPTDNMFQETLNLHNFVKEALPRRVGEIVDHVLVPHRIEAGSSDWVKIEASLISILEVGVACSAELPRERMAITDAMAEMCRIRNKLHGNKL
uniref:probable LRR receptor-like serine/threonine-protein kinase At3g47570 n=1 Tax=Fragaria vesca subsp. vesca TaxID=101020 RepID=UPI0005C8F2CA|nr:PREDICTED: probable LRR receptor-like serine/threonine-protein kinase At3g47570 [Fragaria vesca subsp. vesca]